MAKQYGMVIDTTRCMGCQTCVVACKVSNDAPGDIYWGHVLSLDGDAVYRPTGTFPQVKMNFRPTLCNHCAEPACVANCPTGAMQKDEDLGIVNNDKDICIGCMTCQKSCPYNHPQQFADGLSWKCVMCTDESPDATPDPACAKACPMRCIEFGPIEELREKHPQGEDKIGELSNETSPNVVFELHRDASKGGALMNPAEVASQDAV